MFQALSDWVAVESDSSNIQKRAELQLMMEKVAEKLRLIGASVQLVDIGQQDVSDQCACAVFMSDNQ